MDKQINMLVIGSVNMDMTVAFDEMAKAGQTVYMNGYSYSPGGKGGNAATAASRLGAKVSFCGAVGRDDNGEKLAGVLKAEGMDLTYLKRTDEKATGFAAILLDETNKQNRIFVYSGANRCTTPEDVRKIDWSKFDLLMMPMEIDDEVIFEAGIQAHKHGVPFILDTGPARDIALENIPGLDIISPNETECKVMTGIDPIDDTSCEKAAKLLIERSHAKYAVIKLGARGSFVYGEGISKFVPSFKIEAVDPTAAGDTFTAVMSLKYIETGDIVKSAVYGNAAGALCASRAGAQVSLPKMEEVEAFLQERTEA
ncbi:MAG: ribokinase [Clostridia bacterium]|nr:ribokinase [Clostridia bacterium]